MAQAVINGITIYSSSELSEMPVSKLRTLFSEARGAELYGYASTILNVWEDILSHKYPRRIDRQS